MKLDIGIQGDRFVDRYGRQVLLRGVNLGGDCKVPYPGGSTDHPSGFADHREVSFIGRPFPLEEADEHLGRIAGWGFNCLRLLTTWEAVEHAGPGRYDEAYLDYFAEVVRRAAAHGLQVFVDFHQDVWSRMSGGDGAPGWVFEALGLDFTRFDAAGAAHVMQHRYDYASDVRRQEDRYPMMSWGNNYRMPVNGIMWTAFFAGAMLTPQWVVDGRNVQDFLQGHYFGAMGAMARRLRDAPNVMGFDSLNEPGSGWIGQSLSYQHFGPSPQNPWPARPGSVWSPLSGLQVARGRPTPLPQLERDAEGRTTRGEDRVVNPDGVSIWTSDAPDPFERAGVWRAGDGAALREDAFTHVDGREIDHERDFMAPFFAAAAAAVRAENPDWLLFAELDPFAAFAGHGFPDAMPERTVNASHWYDLTTLVTKQFSLAGSTDILTGETVQGADQMREGYIKRLARIRSAGERLNGGAPTLIGEFGIPYDLNGGDAYARWTAGDRDPDVWRAHADCLALNYDALDELLLNSTQWNYTASNRNDLRIGDGWNQEDLSIYSADQSDGEADGGRAVEGFCRPFVRRAQGVLVSQCYNAAQGVLLAQIDVKPGVTEPTEVYLPPASSKRALHLQLSDPTATQSGEGGIIQIHSVNTGTLLITLTTQTGSGT